MNFCLLALYPNSFKESAIEFLKFFVYLEFNLLLILVKLNLPGYKDMEHLRSWSLWVYIKVYSFETQIFALLCKQQIKPDKPLNPLNSRPDESSPSRHQKRFAVTTSYNKDFWSLSIFVLEMYPRYIFLCVFVYRDIIITVTLNTGLMHKIVALLVSW